VAFDIRQVAVDATGEVRLDPQDRQFWGATIRNAGPSVVTVGLSGVTAGGGYSLQVGAELPVDAGPRDRGLYARCVAGQSATLEIAGAVN
jgi:hypothetical protein